MNSAGRKNIDFRFAKNWRTFLNWYDAYDVVAKCAPPWELQEAKISFFFDSSNPNIVDWKNLWKEFRVWAKALRQEKGILRWSEQQRQIETLMLGQLNELNKPQYILVFLHRGKPEVDVQKMTYWEALHTKENLIGDSNGRGGNEDMDKITIVNLNQLIK